MDEPAFARRARQLAVFVGLEVGLQFGVGVDAHAEDCQLAVGGEDEARDVCGRQAVRELAGESLRLAAARREVNRGQLLVPPTEHSTVMPKPSSK